MYVCVYVHIYIYIYMILYFGLPGGAQKFHPHGAGLVFRPCWANERSIYVCVYICV